MRRGWLAALVAVGIVALLLLLSAPAAAAPGPAQAPQWWFDTWQVPALWAAGADGHGITVAVLDTGVQADLPELQGRVLPGADFAGTGTDGRTDEDKQPFSHGTAMASLIAAHSGSTGILGVAPQAQILPVVVPLSDDGPTASAPAGGTASAIRYAADHGAKIISMSFGGSRYQVDSPQPCPSDVQDAVIYALAKGSLLVAASGNDGANGSPVVQPGVCLGVASVGSVDPDEQVSDFSSRHRYLTMTAPGSEIATLSRRPGAAFLGFGTSQATALAAGALALVWSQHPEETNAQILSRVLSTAEDRGVPGPDPAYGIGFIDPAAALAAPVPTATNAVFAAAQPLLELARTPARSPSPLAPAGRNIASLPLAAVPHAESARNEQFWALASSSAALLALAAGLLALDARLARSARSRQRWAQTRTG